MGKLRRLCYEAVSTFLHQNDNPTTTDIKYEALPSCIVWAIRRRYDEENGEYTGFPPEGELLQKIMHDYDKFSNSMKESKTVVELADPDNGLLTMLETGLVPMACMKL